MVSDRKAQASRENGQRPRGPVSPEGKCRTRLNALKFGLFSQESVVAAAGETLQEFESLHAKVWDTFNRKTL